MFCAEVKHPPFTHGKSKLEVDTTRQLAKVRIQVERVIGTVPPFFKAPYPSVCTIDKILLLCCTLYNHCDSVVHLLINSIVKNIL